MSEQDIKKIREMLGFLVKQKISERLNKLGSDEKKIYDLTGEKGQVEMVKVTGFAAGKISKIWQKLEDEGLLIKEGKSYHKVI
jgi:hypothetical protein